MIQWQHWFNGYKFEQALGVDGQGSLLQSMGLQRVGHDWVTEQLDCSLTCGIPTCNPFTKSFEDPPWTYEILFIIFLNICPIDFFFFFLLHWVFVAAHKLSLIVECEIYSPAVVHGHLFVWLLFCRAQDLGHACFSSCGTYDQLPRGMRDASSEGICAICIGR